VHKVCPKPDDRWGNSSTPGDLMDFSTRTFVKELSGVHTIDVQYRQSSGGTAKIANAVIQLFRVL
jgi:hypothetical protein